ncbi:MAG: multidrug efflux RND transporter permease subunit [Planctomycetota bacterium]|nr:MAG: multidrug efflux RND transporter permease subunit [Planctomycetota bacterium]
MISRFFIQRPIFAAVISMVITLAGAVSALSLPISLLPPVAPPLVQVSCLYPGANASVVTDTIAAPIEQQVNGVDRLLYMQSQAANDGSYVLSLTFEVGADANLALVQTQNRVQLAMPLLPPVVQKQGVSIKKRSPDILMTVNLVSPDDRYDDLFMSNYATVHIRDELLRCTGVGDILLLGQRDYSLRVWLDPDQLAVRGLTPKDVRDAIAAQNVQVIGGLSGQSPTAADQQLELAVAAVGLLSTPEEFGAIVLEADASVPGTPLVRLRDVARIELGAAGYDQTCRYNGRPSVGLAVFQLPNTNALECSDAIQRKMKDLSTRFPAGLEYAIGYDTTPFITESIMEVVKTLWEAVGLVTLVVLLFLQNWRATLIPLVAVPVAIVGTFAAMAAMGFSLNTLSLFGLVLSIGIVVDDAIVVVENVERWIAQGLAPRAAAEKAMAEVTGPVIGVAAVLSAVFVPCGFIGGVTGLFFRQFALTIAVSTILSAVNSLTLSPALAAILLRPHGSPRDPIERLLDRLLGPIFRLFNRFFDAVSGGYARGVAAFVGHRRLVMLGYLVLVLVTWRTFAWYPQGFVPLQDQRYLIVTVQLPDGASVQRTGEVLDRIDRLARQVPGVTETFTVSGMSFLYNSNAPNWGSMFLVLDDYEKRRTPETSMMGIIRAVRERVGLEIADAEVGVYPAPPVKGLGTAGGFKFYLQDRGALGPKVIQESIQKLVAAMESWRLPFVVGSYRADSPQFFLDIDRDKIRSLGIPISAVLSTLQMDVGSFYVNNFTRFGRTWQVKVMANEGFRSDVEDLRQLKVAGADGGMVPLATVLDIRNSMGPAMMMRYNLYPAAPITGIPNPFQSGSELIDRVAVAAASELPESFSYEWSEVFFLQIKAGNTAGVLLGLGIMLVFLVLAALYESWAQPLAVILVVPICLLAAVGGLLVAKLPIDILAQVGLVVLVGLASKNAILIVEFARQLQAEGHDPLSATLTASRLRLRPILMTSLAFILGVFPLVVARGAGAELRWSLGITVFAGMIGVTLVGIFLTPVFYYVLTRPSTPRREVAAQSPE